MVTSVINWHVVTLIGTENGIFKGLGKVLWAIVIVDDLGRYMAGDYLCTSLIMEINPDYKTLITRSGNVYELIGDGRLSEIPIESFSLLAGGMSPDEILKRNYN